ncbi:MAG TPA: class I SAM-dependent methyltransferase [Ruminococcaceae bacterium]|nr:class I SAM-dependent methyltransferase [Oscillospiraceae bacterium]
MKKGNYGLDAPGIVSIYLVAGVVCLISGLRLSVQTYDYGWLIAVGLILLAVGGYMIYSSKCGKYKMREKILKRIAVRENDTALDVGCGRGLMLNGLASKLKTGKAYGIDLWSHKDQSGNNTSAVMKNAKLEGTADRITVQSADMRKMPFADETFSVIVSSLAIHNIKGDEERKKAILEIARVAKNGCRIAILDIAHIQEYADILEENDCMVERLDKHLWRMFPPASVLFARKQKIPVYTSKK